jgi:hypothetical protein
MRTRNRMVELKLSVLVLLLWIAFGCASAPPVSPQGQLVWKANEVVVALGTLQHTAIELNKVQVCEPAPCRPLLSDKNTGVVVDSVTSTLKVLRGVPSGWRTIVRNALSQILERLDDFGQQRLRPYIEIVAALAYSL